VARPFLAVLLGFPILVFSSSVIPTGMADLFFRAEVWRVGHGVEGPRQHFNRISTTVSSNALFECGSKAPAFTMSA
jgi:hypothetical protein